MNPAVDQYLLEGCGRCELHATPQCKVHSWNSVLVELRSIVNESELREERKWGSPCYTLDGKNILMIYAFKNNAAISFFKGALLKDPEKLLEKPGENSQSARFFRVTDVNTLIKNKVHLKAYIQEAIHAERSGLKVDSGAKKDLEYPEELLISFEDNPELANSFEALTPGRKRGYILHFNQAKQSKTRFNRIEKCTSKILSGKGWNEY